MLLRYVVLGLLWSIIQLDEVVSDTDLFTGAVIRLTTIEMRIINIRQVFSCLCRFCEMMCNAIWNSFQHQPKIDLHEPNAC